MSCLAIKYVRAVTFKALYELFFALGITAAGYHTMREHFVSKHVRFTIIIPESNAQRILESLAALCDPTVTFSTRNTF